MTYKTILTCLTTEFAAECLLPAACNIARRFDAHLNGIHTREAYVPYPGIPIHMDDDLLDQFNERVMQEDKNIEAMFKETTERAGCTSEWRSRLARSVSTTDEVLRSAYRSDLIITLPPDREHERFDQAGIQKDLIVHSGCPVLLVPENWGEKPIGTRTMIAWKPTREATRALHNGLPFLKAAEYTGILTVESPRKSALEDSIEGHEVARSLSRHGVTPEVRHVPAESSEIGTRILIEAAGQNCDLVIMGAYGRSRLQRLIFGDASGHMLREAGIPVLMSG